MLPFLVVIVGASPTSRPGSTRLGLHGASLGLSVGLAGFVVGALGIRQTMLTGRRRPGSTARSSPCCC